MPRSTTSSSRNSIKQQPEQERVISDNASETSHETAEPALYSHEGSDEGSRCGRKRWIIAGILVLVLVGIATALGLTLHEEKEAQQLTETSSKSLRGSATTDLEDTSIAQASPSTGVSSSRVESPVQPGKKEWPELIGTKIEQAKSIITQERPDLNVIVVQVGDFVTSDYDTQRVWLWESEAGLVDRLPRVG
jgi:CCR4-NOT transcriptional regulation complex NOT5 subunit